jgi:hypothetical protein
MPANVRGHLRHALLIVCGLMGLGPGTSQDAIAQTIPSYGTNAHCQRLAGFGGTFSRSVYGSCLNVEQSAALALQGRWSLNPGVRARALRPHRQLWRVRLLLDPSELRGCGNGCAGGFRAPRRRGYCEVLSSDV